MQSHRRISRVRRHLPTAIAIGLTLAVGATRAQQGHLPDMGSSAARIITPAEQREYGAMTLAQLRRFDYTLDDPLLGDWLQGVGNRLVASSDANSMPFTFFLLREREINAFATLGGYVAVNSGLVLTAEREDEVAAVLAHEVSHVSQSHVLRAVERAQRDQLPILLAMLGAIVVAQKAGGGGNSASNATMAAVAGAQGLLVQRQLDYSRSNESEADRVGIRLLARAGYDPNAMAGFFERMETAMRANRGGDREQTPDYLLTHPVTGTRIAEAKARAAQMSSAPVVTNIASRDNPLLPPGMRVQVSQRAASGIFDFAKERMRALTAATPALAVQEYERMATRHPLNDAQRYGQAVARLAAGQYAPAGTILGQLLQKHPDNWWLAVGMAEADNGLGHRAEADSRLNALIQRMPGNRAIAIAYAQILNQRGGRAAGQHAVEVLRPLTADGGDDPVFQSAYGRAAEQAGDTIRAGEAYAQAAYLNGNPQRALLQLHTLKRRPDLDYYARTRIDARITAITPEVLEMRKQGIRDMDTGPNDDKNLRQTLDSLR
ncbi:M48 family metalloprotease [Solilutibacter silvestris]